MFVHFVARFSNPDKLVMYTARMLENLDYVVWLKKQRTLWDCLATKPCHQRLSFANCANLSVTTSKSPWTTCNSITMPSVTKDLLQKVSGKLKKKKSGEPAPKKSKTADVKNEGVAGSPDAAAATKKTNEQEKQQQTAICQSATLIKFNALLSVGLASRVRGIESMLLWCYMFDSDDECMDSMGEIGKEHNNSIAEAKKNGTSYDPEAPVHIMMWIAVMEILSPSITAIASYTEELHADYLVLTKDVLYFRKIRCHDKTKSRMLVHLRPDSQAEMAWLTHVVPHLKSTKGVVQKFGVAPRSGPERKLLHELQRLGVLKKFVKDFSAMDGDDG